MRRVYMPDVPDGEVRLEVTGDEVHHLARVVRVSVGEAVSVFDGCGREWLARVDAVGRQTVELLLEGAVTPVAEPPVVVTLGIGVLKGDQMDAVVRDATVMGVSMVVPLVTDHVTVPHRAWRDDGARARWERVAIAAAKQCGRAVVPTITPVTPLNQMWDMAVGAGDSEITLACIEPAAAAAPSAGAPFAETDWRTVARPASALLLVGPEGGWSAAEITKMAERHGYPVSLGPRTIRAEAVPAVAMTMLWSVWGW